MVSGWDAAAVVDCHRGEALWCFDADGSGDRGLGKERSISMKCALVVDKVV